MPEKHDSEYGRRDVVGELMTRRVGRLLDIGCGPLVNGYYYAEHAESVTAVDWKPKIIGKLEPHVTVMGGDFLNLDFEPESFDLVLMSEVLEHVQLEMETSFAAKAVSLLKPGGELIVSVPHRGTFHLLDPYHVKPFLGWVKLKLGLTRQLHNGFCDVRKLHKHYKLDELKSLFAPMEPKEVRRWGYVHSALDSWGDGIQKAIGFCPFKDWTRRGKAREARTDYGERSFNVAVRFVKPMQSS